MLTEKKLLASPATDYMSDDQLDFFNQRLQELKQHTIENLTSFRDTISVNEIEADPLDTACDEEIKQIVFLGVKRDTELLHQIESSLDRIHKREYGFCQETGDPIGLRRLLANPNATLSTEALQNRENMERLEGKIIDLHEDA